jgi:hypothetical protein
MAERVGFGTTLVKCNDVQGRVVCYAFQALENIYDKPFVELILRPL